jgi:hypothetical protein
MQLSFLCIECNEPVAAQIDWRNAGEDFVIKIEPCECQSKAPKGPVKMYYGDLLEHLDSTRVEVSYFKKNGDYRPMTGFLGVPHESNSSLVYFIEKDADEPARVKCLFKKNIASILDLSEDKEYQLMGGLHS